MGALNPAMARDAQVPAVSARLFWTTIGLVWLVSAVLIGWGAYQLREQVRRQVVERDAELFHALSRPYRAPTPEEDEALPLDSVQLFYSMARPLGIIAARLYSGDGRMMLTIPENVEDAVIPQEAWAKLIRMQLSSRFEPEYSMAEVYLSTNAWVFSQGAQAIPVVEVFIPLQSGMSPGPSEIAWFLLDGEPVRAEFERFDRQLLFQVLVLLGAAFTITGGALHWAFRRLIHAHALLAARTEDLLRANRELSQSVRVAAVGAMTAHLMHGLKSPMSGLSRFMAARVQSEGGRNEAWVEALAATRRMQSLIQGVSRVVGEQSAEYTYHVSPRELAESIAQKVRPMAEASQVHFVVVGDPPGKLENRTAGLLGLLLTNLVENAIQASPVGETVALSVGAGDRWEFEVSDRGPGLAPDVMARLFEPQRSTKEGGSGLGLAITRQLAMALGGTVRLSHTGPAGTTFRVEIPFVMPRLELAESGTAPTVEGP